MNDPLRDLVNEFKTFHSKNPEVYELFKTFTFRAINAGHIRLSSEMIINRIRWETSVETTDKDYKINNDYKPFYSRMFMNEYPARLKLIVFDFAMPLSLLPQH